MVTLDDIRRLDLRARQVVWNYPVDLFAMLERLEHTPWKLRKEIDRVVEQALEAAAGAQPRIRKQRLLVWTKRAVWLNADNRPTEVINTKVSTRSSELRCAELFTSAFKVLPEFLYPEGGGDPIADGAIPSYWYRDGTHGHLLGEDKIAVVKFCEQVFAEEQDTLVLELASNPYSEIVHDMEDQLARRRARS